MGARREKGNCLRKKETVTGEEWSKKEFKAKYSSTTTDNEKILVLLNARRGERVLVFVHVLDYSFDVVTTHISAEVPDEEDDHPSQQLRVRVKYEFGQ